MRRFARALTFGWLLAACGPGAIPSGLWAVTGAEFLRLEVPAARGALAAGAADTGGSELMLRNPAGILGQAHPGLAFTHFSAWGDFSYEQLEGAYPGLWGGTGGARIFYAGSHDLVALDDQGLESGSVAYHDLLLHVAYARPLGENVHAGLALKGFESQLQNYHSLGCALDAGVRYQTPWPGLALGASLLNLGGRSAFLSEADSLPLQAAAGLAMRAESGVHGFKFLADYSQVLVSAESGLAGLGMEYSLLNSAFLRLGYRLNQDSGRLSAGAGLRAYGLGLDYAYQPFSELGLTHRLTLSYVFLPPARPADPASRPMPAPNAKIRELTSLPRSFESSVVIKTPSVDPRVREWDFEIRDSEGQLVRTISGTGKPPEYVKWDGRNQAGDAIVAKDTYHFVFKAGQQAVAAMDLPTVRPSFKLDVSQHRDLEPEVRFSLNNRPEVTKWSLAIVNEKTEQTLHVLSAAGQLPEQIIWDGRDEKGALVDTGLPLRYLLSVVYPNGSQLAASEKIRPIAAREVQAPAGETGLLILNILFDFNSAVLKPEMTDKMMAAIGLLQKYGSQARAVCEGHADDVGTETYNQWLSLERAKLARQFLISQPQIDPGQVAAEGFGTKRPDNQQDTDAGRARNRRVEIRIFFPSTPKPQPPK
ncbi:MAG: PorV/PorQ family protein [candidate division FCPU426 bacterium]